jgi:hypothetical protein
MNILVYTSLIFWPLQFLSIDFFTSSYDITALIFVCIGFLLMFYHFKINVNLIIILLLFTIIQIVTFLLLGAAPTYRFISGLIWIGSLLLLLANGNKNLEGLDLRILWIITISLLIFSCLVLWFEYYFIITPERYNTERLLRPRGTYGEPSYASLVFYSGAAACYSSLIFSNQKKLFYSFLFIVFFGSGLITLGMHIVTFFISILIFTGIWLSYNLSIKKIFFVLVVSLISIYLASYLMEVEHFSSRLNFIGSEGGTTNGSLLSWLRGFDQMKQSIINSPLIGMGLGSTGKFPFESIYGEILARHGLYELTLYDAFSLAFRFIIELGLLHFAILTIFMVYKLNTFKKYLIKFKKINIPNYTYTIFLLTFAISLFIGSMIKEPNYARSTLFISIFLIAILPELNKKNE